MLGRQLFISPDLGLGLYPISTCHCVTVSSLRYIRHLACSQRLQIRHRNSKIDDSQAKNKKEKKEKDSSGVLHVYVFKFFNLKSVYTLTLFNKAGSAQLSREDGEENIQRTAKVR